MLPINSSVSECFQTFIPALKLIPYPSRVTRGALVLSFISDAGTLLPVCSEDHSNMSDLTLEMGCNLSFPRALCLILLIREREKRVSPLCVLCIHPPSSLYSSHSTNYWIRRHTTGSHLETQAHMCCH